MESNTKNVLKKLEANYVVIVWQEQVSTDSRVLKYVISCMDFLEALEVKNYVLGHHRKYGITIAEIYNKEKYNSLKYKVNDDVIYTDFNSFFGI